MKRLAAGDLSSRTSLFTAHNRADLPPDLNRTRTSGGELVSLMEPIPGQEGQAPRELFLQWSKRLQAQDEPNSAQEHAAVETILLLDGEDKVGDADARTLALASDMLLKSGQAVLLCRLVQLTRMHCVLDVGSNPHAADVLARMRTTWPRDLPVSIKLATALPLHAVTSLHGFMRRPSELSVKLVANRTEGPVTAEAFSALLRLRPIAGLNIVVESALEQPADNGGRVVANVAALDVLQALPGVVARAIGIQFGYLYAGHAQVEAALVECVQQSGATMLDVSDKSVEPDVAQRLLACRRGWDIVHVRLQDDVLQAWLRSGQNTVGRLELHPQDGSMSVTFANDFERLSLLAQNGVHTFVAHGTQDLMALAFALGQHAMRSEHVFERIEGCFVVSVNAKVQDVDRALVFLARNHNVLTMTHRPMAIASDLTIPIDVDATARLNGMSAMNRLMPAEERAAAQRQIKALWWSRAVHTLSGLLAESRQPLELIAHLSTPDNMLCLPVNVHGVLEEPQNDSARAKVQVLAAADVPADLVKAAITDWVGTARAQELAPMCQALIAAGCAWRVRTDAEWRALGSGFHQTWMREGMPSTQVDAITPLPSPDPNVRAPVGNPAVPGASGAAASQPPTAVAAARAARANPDALVTPPGAASRQTLRDRMQVRLAAIGHGFVAHRDAIRMIMDLLDTGTINPARAAAGVMYMAHELLSHGQAALLKHIIARVPAHWPVVVQTEPIAAALADLHGWPDDPQCTCALVISTNLSPTAAAQAIAFANTVKPEQLTLHVDIQSPTYDTIWDDLSALIQSRAGLALQMALSPRTLFIPTDGLTRLLNNVKGTPIRSVGLDRLDVGDESFLRAMADVLKDSQVKGLHLTQGSDALAQATLPCRAWDRLTVHASRTVAVLFGSAAVAATQLVVNMDRLEPEDRLWVESIVGGCKGLKSVEIARSPFNILSLTRALARNPTVEEFIGTLSAMDAREVSAALRLMRRNTSLLYVEETSERFSDNGERRLGPRAKQGVSEIMTRNRLRRPELSAQGTGKGFGWSLGDGRSVKVGPAMFHAGTRPFVEWGGIMGPYLDAASVVALASTSKAAYVGSRDPWEIEVDRLAGLLTIEDHDEFAAMLVNQLTHLRDDLTAPPDETSSSEDAPARRFLDKVIGMQAVGVPASAITQAIGRLLLAQQGSARDLLEALAYLGAMPPEVWLREGLGIVVPNRTA